MKRVIDKVFSFLSIVVSHLCKLLTYMIGIILALMATILFVSVLMRYVFSNPIPWTEDVLNILMVWMVLLGAPVGLRAGSHVAIEIVVEKLPSSLQKVFQILVIFIVAFVSVQILRYGWVFAIKGMRRIVPSLDWLKFGYVYMALPVGYGMLLLVLLEQLVGEIQHIFVRKDA